MLKDQKELLSAFNEHKVKYLVVGGHAVGFHAEPRGTKVLDVFISSDKANGEAVYRALTDFGASLADVAPSDFYGHTETVFQFGVPPSRIDIIQKIAGIEFDEAWKNRVEIFADINLPTHVISRDDLIANKLAVGRTQDIADVEKIREAAAAQQAAPSLPNSLRKQESSS